MKKFVSFGKKLHQFCSSSCTKIACLGKSSGNSISCFCWFTVIKSKPFWIQLCYFVSVSLVGWLVLEELKTRTSSFKPRGIDMFFMSVSAVTVSSMSTVEMEVFSNTQLIFMTVLMLVGGEVFISMVGLQFVKSKFKKFDNKVDVITDNDLRSSAATNMVDDQIELGLATVANLEYERPRSFGRTDDMIIKSNVSENHLKYKSLRFLNYVVLGYLIVFLVGGSTLVIVYLTFVPSASDVLKNKGIQLHTFSVFTVVSTFTNCGFVPTNENMVVFKNNPGLLLILIPQVLFGNTLYPPCLRFVIWSLGKLTRRDEFQYMLKNTREMEYHHLLPSLQSLLLVCTVVLFILVQFILFCCMEWNSDALDGMSAYQKVVGTLFVTINSRHTGESIVDLSIISPAVLVLFVLMMYLPPYTSFMPMGDDEQYNRSCEKRKKQKQHVVENLLFSQLTYLVIFIILICITERKKMKDDPLNFTLLNIVIEVVSAYGNVGFSTGYSCKRQINPNGHCKDTWYGFSGRWSDEGKLILILVMFFGRLKKFYTGGGKAWKLL
ncbi:hypothetical protein AQUCO_01800147v1 [Aquilegia coerulea]|uniref:Cation transporter n=1 Tax=Aquilegia coerulea TaxID=218851 RepID=A0A2G5DK57_AQUCA|nr:hypothetical protein AQUCO_01800147v1 [Aquilegia coerulea]